MTMRIDEARELLRRIDSDPGAWRNDASVSAYAERELTYVLTQMFQTDYPRNMFREILPVSNEVPAGAETFEAYLEDHVGEAEVTDDYASDSPASDATLSKDTRKIAALRTHFNYSVQDMRNALMAGRSLQERKAMSARDKIERGLDKVAALGDSRLGITGFLNDGNVTRVDAADPGSGTEWSIKTADQRNEDIFDAISAIQVATNQTEGQQVDLVLPPAQMFLLQSTRVADTGMSGLGYLRANVDAVRNVWSWFRLTGAGQGGSDRMVVFDRNPAKLEAIVPLELYAHTPEQRGMTWQVELEARTGGTAIYKPGSMRYVDGI